MADTATATAAQSLRLVVAHNFGSVGRSSGRAAVVVRRRNRAEWRRPYTGAERGREGGSWRTHGRTTDGDRDGDDDVHEMRWKRRRRRRRRRGGNRGFLLQHICCLISVPHSGKMFCHMSQCWVDLGNVTAVYPARENFRRGGGGRLERKI